ncbi:uncharacterized protein LOC132169462 [Corylus avellana]|uniref:uncharacterized protein LOC132169462 n=1 Tax=Corylus avellana TaxID=13451 RepID=UPI002869FB10|nr:uncharacterized protein LOC132169462 [Corylus avellana]
MTISDDMWAFSDDPGSSLKTDFPDKSTRNKKNRSELKTNHTSGSRSFLNHRHSEAGEDEEEPNLIDFYKISHTNKDGKFVTPQCEERYNLMVEKLADKEVEVDEEEIFT